MNVHRNCSGNEVFSDSEKRLAEQLAQPEVDEVFADRHIRETCERIQSRWTRTERRHRDCYRGHELETVTVPCGGVHNGIRMCG